MTEKTKEPKAYQQTDNHITIAVNGKEWISSDKIVEIKN